jgi:Fe-S-cluster containining protein
MLFDRCAECQSCCHIDAGFPPLEITLSKAEKKKLGRLCIETACDHLGSSGCTLGHEKPFGCQLYPLAYNPDTQDFFFDAACPLMPEYQQQLGDSTSEASQHLSTMTAAIHKLSTHDKAFLRRNFQVDSDYFDIQPLRPPQ